MGELCRPSAMVHPPGNPDTRRLLSVQLGSMDFAATEGLITQLMGKGEAASRRALMELHGDAVEVGV